MVRTKVFVGNLSFKTREAELAQEFAAAGHVIGANIITRGPRSLGYGFVEFEDEEAAESAVKIMNKKEIDGRAINVEVAKPREDENPENSNNDQTQANGSNNDNTNNTRGGFRGRGRGGFRGGRGGRGGRGARGGFFPRGGRGGAPTGGPGYRRRFNNDENNTNETEGNNNNNNNNNQQADRPPRRRFNRRPEGENQPDNRTESKTTLFIANLPFSLDDAGFGKVFTDNGLKFKSAHVVQKRNGRSKGFGFAEFDGQEDQVKALETLNAKKVEERELIVKVALTEQQPPQQQGENNNNNNTTPAPEIKKEETKKEDKKEEKK
jgi:RNA recognition motif-containing protein